MRAARGSFTGSAEFLDDPGNRARVGEYLADLARPYGHEVPSGQSLSGQSYGEMAQSLISSAVRADEPVDLLVLAFAVHDLRPGRQTASYLSHVTPGAPMAFAICDQGSAAAFSGLRIAAEYVSSAGIKRALVIVAEQPDLPYKCTAPVPTEARAVAMLYSDHATSNAGQATSGPGEAASTRGQATTRARVAGIRQHPGVAPGAVADLAAASALELAAGHRDARLVLSAALAAAWPGPAAGLVRVMPAGQPSTEAWWGLIDELASDAGHPDLLLIADYDPDLRYLSLAAFSTTPPP